MKTYRGVEVGSIILNISTRWSLRPLPLYPRGNSPRYPLYRRWVVPTAGMKSYEEKENLLLLPGT
jgi:hypothetical protein